MLIPRPAWPGWSQRQSPAGVACGRRPAAAWPGPRIRDASGPGTCPPCLQAMNADRILARQRASRRCTCHPVSQREVTMSATTREGPRSASGSQTTATLDMPLEVVVVPVSDVDRAKEFYSRLGWRLDADRRADGFRLVQFTPPGSGCSVQFGTGLTTAPPGSAQALMLTVADIQAARDALAGPAPRSATFSIAPLGLRAGSRTATAHSRASTALRPTTPVTAPSPPSATLTATAGCSRKSLPGCLAGSKRGGPRSGRLRTWPMR